MRKYFVDIKRFALLCLLLVVALADVAFAQAGGDSAVVRTISPFDFGLAGARSDSARYEVLYATHCHAVDIGATVSYSGVGAVTVEVTASSRPIPLTRRNDFGGLHLTVKNSAKEHCLFELKDTLWSVFDLTAEDVDA
ncbi:MAG: hypothetical protein IKO09_07000, partial [Bacteroidales bacterium]|nr:hypothetical protein [Bacteroidales bacterium]